MNRLTLTGVLTSFGVLSILAPALAQPPTPSATRPTDEEFEKAQRDMSRLAGELLSVRTDVSDPSLDDLITISKRQWQIMQAKVNLLMLPSDSLQLEFNPIGNPGIDPLAAKAGTYGFWFWSFTRTDPDEDKLVVDALWALVAVTNALTDVHVNAHCFAVTVPGRDGKLTRRYVTFDSNEFGDLMPPHISTSPPRMSTTRRQEIVSIFAARTSLRRQVNDCTESMSQITDRDELIERNGKCGELQGEYRFVDRMIPGTGGLWQLLGEARAGKKVALTNHRRAVNSTREGRQLTDALQRARQVATFLDSLNEASTSGNWTDTIWQGCTDACDREALCSMQCINRADSILFAYWRLEHRDDR